MAGHSLLKVIVGCSCNMLLVENLKAVVFVAVLLVLVSKAIVFVAPLIVLVLLMFCLMLGDASFAF
jgi:hypothetical protein